MSKLEEIKEVSNDIKELFNKFYHKQADIAKCYFYEKYGDYLINQAEQVEDIAMAYEHARKEILVLKNKVKALQNKLERK